MFQTLSVDSKDLSVNYQSIISQLSVNYQSISHLSYNILQVFQRAELF